MHGTTLATMSKSLGRWTLKSSPMLPFPSAPSSPSNNLSMCCGFKGVDLKKQRGKSVWCGARRQIRYEDGDEEINDEYGHNEDIAKLEFYSQSAKGEALLVHALVDQLQVDVLIFKGFSSCLSYTTSPDPTRSILPARAVIVSIDRIKGPFDPSNIEYLQKGLTWEDFKTNVLSN